MCSDRRSELIKYLSDSSPYRLFESRVVDVRKLQGALNVFLNLFVALKEQVVELVSQAVELTENERTILEVFKFYFELPIHFFFEVMLYVLERQVLRNTSAVCSR